MDLNTARRSRNEIRATVDATVVARGIEEVPKVAFGIATTAAPNDFKIAVRARSPEDLPPEIDEKIRTEGGKDIDFQYTGPVEARPHTVGEVPQSGKRLASGASVAHYRCTAGTLGFFAQRNSDRAIGFVSNNHVIALEDAGREGDEILHPAPSDAGVRWRDAVAFLDGRYPKIHQQHVVVDAAFARLAPGVAFDPRIQGKKIVTVSPDAISADLELDVCKVGRSTGLTRGRITAFEFEPFYIEYSFGSVRAENQIEIESSSEQSFSVSGDSGSLIVSAGSRQPLGLLFAKSAVGGKYENGLSYANPIDAVLEALGVTLIT
jgi:hypothetical protein